MRGKLPLRRTPALPTWATGAPPGFQVSPGPEKFVCVAVTINEPLQLAAAIEEVSDAVCRLPSLLAWEGGSTAVASLWVHALHELVEDAVRKENFGSNPPTVWLTARIGRPLYETFHLMVMLNAAARVPDPAFGQMADSLNRVRAFRDELISKLRAIYTPGPYFGSPSWDDWPSHVLGPAPMG